MKISNTDDFIKWINSDPINKSYCNKIFYHFPI